MSSAYDNTLSAPWERQSGESAKAFDAFIIYRDMEPRLRSVERAYEAYTGKKLPHRQRAPGHITRWAVGFSWVRRALQWDMERDRRKREEQLEADRRAIEEMNERHIKMSLAVQTKVADALRSFDEKRIQSMTPYGIIRWMTEATKVERLSRGEPDHIVDNRGLPPAPEQPQDEDGTSGDAILLRILANPQATRAARDLALALERETLENEPGSDSVPGK